MTLQTIQGDIHNQGSIDAQGNVHIGHQIVHNYYGSADWQKLQQRLNDALENYHSFPEHSKFAQQLQKVQDEIEAFKRDIIKLAADFQTIPLNTERLKQAKAYFDQGDYDKARAVLDTEALNQELDLLLLDKESLEEKLAAKADEFMLLARLTALNFDLGEERIPKTCAAFESALKAQRTPQVQFDYAFFLTDERQYSLAEKHYREVLNSLDLLDETTLSSADCPVYLVEIIDHFASLLIENNEKTAEALKIYEKSLLIARNAVSKKQDKAEYYLAIALNSLATALDNYNNSEKVAALHQEALEIRRFIADKEPSLSSDWAVSQTLHNLANALSLDPTKHTEAEALYREALIIRRRAASQNEFQYAKDLAKTSHCLGSLLSDNPEKTAEAEVLYQESLAIFRRLSQRQPNLYEDGVSRTLSNLADLFSPKIEAEAFYQEALAIRRHLFQQYPSIHQVALARLLFNFACFLSNFNERHLEAKDLYKEALTLQRTLAQQQPTVYMLNLVRVLGATGWSHLQSNEPQTALPYLEEALYLLQSLYDLHPTGYSQLYEITSYHLHTCRQQLSRGWVYCFSEHLTNFTHSFKLKL